MHFGVSAPPCLLSQRASICYYALGVLEVWLRSVLLAIGFGQTRPTPLSVDNASTISLTQDQKGHSRTKQRDSSIWPRARHIDVSKPHAPPARKRGQANDHAAAQVKSARPIAWIPSCLHTRRTPHGGARHRRSPGQLPRRGSRSSVSPAVQNPRIDVVKVEGPHLLYPPVSSRSRLQLSMGHSRFDISIPVPR